LALGCLVLPLRSLFMLMTLFFVRRLGVVDVEFRPAIRMACRCWWMRICVR